LFDVDDKGRVVDFGDNLNSVIEKNYKEMTMKFAAALLSKRRADKKMEEAQELAKKEADHEVFEVKKDKLSSKIRD
jgi:hypothetical protein